MASGWKGFSPFQSHDYPEYEMPSKQYENGPITYFEVITGLSRPYHNNYHKTCGTAYQQPHRINSQTPYYKWSIAQAHPMSVSDVSRGLQS